MSPHRPTCRHCPVSLADLGPGFHTVPRAEVDRDPAATPPPIDYAPLYSASAYVARWLLDTARTRTTDPGDLGALARVRAAIDLRATDRAARISVDEHDLLTVLGLLITTFERELDVGGLADLAGALYAAGPAMLGRLLRHRPARVPIAVERRPCVAHRADEPDDDGGPLAFLTFR